jgi:hypothetical protein
MFDFATSIVKEIEREREIEEYLRCTLQPLKLRR